MFFHGDLPTHERFVRDLVADSGAMAGNSVGGNMAAVVALMTRQKGGPALRAQLLFWPVTNAYARKLDAAAPGQRRTEDAAELIQR